MKLKRIVIDEKAIRITSEMRLESSNPEVEDTRNAKDSFHEAPEPEFTKAIEALLPVVVSVMEMEKKWISGLSVKGIRVRETKQGTRSVMIDLHKRLDEKDNEWKFPTPWFRIDSPQDGEDGALQVTKGQADKVAEALYEAERYRDGHRLSDQLLMDLAVTEEEGGEDELGLAS